MLIVGGVYVKHKLWIFDRWDIREIIDGKRDEGIIYFWSDVYDIEKLKEELAFIIATPVDRLN